MKDEITLRAGVMEPAGRPLAPFSEQVMAFLEALSRRIQAEGRSLAPEIAAFGFWCRRAHLLRLRERHESASTRLGRGLLFHVTPANVPVMFAYSYAVGLLAGNGNIVRLSSRTGETGRLLCGLIEETLADFPEIRERTSIITYEKNDAVTADYMSRCDGRIIWGGDRTVAEMRRFPMPPHAVEVVFPDRWSFALIGQRALSEMDEETLLAHVHSFYNDTYIMDQMGCSSPQMVLWLRDGGDERIRERFWELLSREARASYPVDGYRAARKLEKACLASMEDKCVAEFRRYGGNALYVLRLKDLPENLSAHSGGFGLFYEAELRDFAELTDRLDPRVQTISCIGVDRQALAAHLAKTGARGVDRIVDAGRALEMDTVWDGKDLIALLSREISLGAGT